MSFFSVALCSSDKNEHETQDKNKAGFTIFGGRWSFERKSVTFDGPLLSSVEAAFIQGGADEVFVELAHAGSSSRNGRLEEAGIFRF
ncbi:hypothetical protein GQ457_07G044400 [Hibiscus cannabinus]